MGEHLDLKGQDSSKLHVAGVCKSFGGCGEEAK